MKVLHVSFADPVPPPLGDVRTSIRHLQSERPDHAASYWPEISLAGNFVVAGAARYPLARVARLLMAEEAEVESVGEPGAARCCICGGILGARQALRRQSTCGRACAARWRATRALSG